MGNDMVKEKAGCSVCRVVEFCHGFFPFGEVVDSDYNVFIPIDGAVLCVMKLIPHLQKGSAMMTGWRGTSGDLSLCIYN